MRNFEKKKDIKSSVGWEETLFDNKIFNKIEFGD